MSEFNYIEFDSIAAKEQVALRNKFKLYEAQLHADNLDDIEQIEVPPEGHKYHHIISDLKKQLLGNRQVAYLVMLYNAIGRDIWERCRDRKKGL